MNVGQIANEWYKEHEPEGSLAQAILRCFFNPCGVIIKRPGFLLMGETCRTDGRTFIEGTPHNAWYCHFWTCEKGSMSSYDLTLEVPFPMEFVAFKRRGRIHILKWERLYWKDIRTKPRELIESET